MNERKFATILGVLGNPTDRFMSRGYKADAPDVFERIALAAKIQLVRGLEIIQGEHNDFTSDTQQDVLKAIRDHGMQVCAVNPDLSSDPDWGKGTLGSTRPEIRRRAIDLIRKTMDVAADCEAGYVGIWPGQDGYDYVFEADYEKQFDWWIQGIQDCADHNPSIRIGLEYKPYEPRTHSTLDTAPKTLLLLKDIDRPNVGLTLDVGHALVQHENLGEVVSLVQRQKRLFHLHINDNYADWDWDMNFASVRLFEFIEMLYWLKRTDYAGWYSVDIFAYRTDAPASVSESLAWLQTLMDFVDETGEEKFSQLITEGDPIATSRFFRQALFGNTASSR